MPGEPIRREGERNSALEPPIGDKKPSFALLLAIRLPHPWRGDGCPRRAQPELVDCLSPAAVDVKLHPVEHQIAVKRWARNRPAVRFVALDRFQGRIDADE